MFFAEKIWLTWTRFWYSSLWAIWKICVANFLFEFSIKNTYLYLATHKESLSVSNKTNLFFRETVFDQFSFVQPPHDAFSQCLREHACLNNCRALSLIARIRTWNIKKNAPTWYHLYDDLLHPNSKESQPLTHFRNAHVHQFSAPVFIQCYGNDDTTL